MTDPVGPATIRRSATARKAGAGSIDRAVNARMRPVSWEYWVWKVGEDPYLVATIGAAYVRGVESAGVVAVQIVER